jgi:hypothetical protein
VAAGYLNRDGGADLAVVNTLSNTVGVLVNTSTTAAAATTTTLTTAVTGQRELLTATEASPSGTPSGSGTFLDGTTVLATAPVNAGQATLAVSLGAGSHMLTTSFAGTGGFTGTVLGTVAIGPTGVAQLTTSFAPAGGHAVTAVYSGDPNFAGSSQALTEQVNGAATPQATTTTLSASINPPVVGQLVTFTATVRGSAGVDAPTGTVTFRDGNVVLGTVAVGPDGTATFTTSFAAAGGHAITAAYSGDANFAASSQALTEQVNAAATPQATTTALAAPANPARVGQAVTFTATVRGPAGAATPTGTVTFLVNGRVVTRVALDANGRARLTRSFARTGLFRIQAVYSGDVHFVASSQALTEPVN